MAKLTEPIEEYEENAINIRVTTDMSPEDVVGNILEVGGEMCKEIILAQIKLATIMKMSPKSNVITFFTFACSL